MNAVCSELNSQAKYLTITRDMIAAQIFKIATDPKTKAPDKLRALEQLGKYIGMFNQEDDLRKVPKININISDPKSISFNND